MAVASLMPAAGASTARATNPKADLKIAQAATLTIDDFPSGWKNAGKQSSTTNTSSSCSKINKVTGSSKKYRAQSPEFQSSTGQADNAVYVFPKAQDADSYLSPFQDATACLTASAKQSLTKVKGGGQVTVTPLDLSDVISGSGIDDAVGYRVDITTNDEHAILVVVALRIGRAVDGFEFQSDNQPLNEIDVLIDASFGRLTDALGS